MLMANHAPQQSLPRSIPGTATNWGESAHTAGYSIHDLRENLRKRRRMRRCGAEPGARRHAKS